MSTREVRFSSRGVECAAWHVQAHTDELATDAGRPCVVMAHGLGGTRDTGLLPFAEGFAAAGLDVLVFDYRGFGASAGTPRQRVSWRRQRQDYRASVSFARGLPGVDVARIVLWGTSYSGGHVVAVAAADHRIAAVMSMTPAMDGRAALIGMARNGGIAHIARLIVDGLRDVARAALRRDPLMIPLVGPAASNAMMAKDGAAELYTAIAGPTWRNEVCARGSLGVAMNRPIRRAHRLSAPLLVQIGENDTVVPQAAAEATAGRAGSGARVQRYPVDHFDVYAGAWQDRLLADQIDFLRQHLASNRSTELRTVG